MSNTEEILVVGQIGAAYGIRGWVHVRSFTDPPSNLIEYSPWFINQTADPHEQWEEVELLGAHQHNKGLVAQLTLADNRTQAEGLKGLNVGVTRESLPEPEEDSFYWHDLIGSDVLTRTGVYLGELSRVIETGAHSVIEVHGEGQHHLIPFVKPYVQTVNSGDRIVVDWEENWS